MVSKGIQTFAYIGVEGVEVLFSVPGTSITRTDRTWTHDHLEVDKKNLGALKMSGRFSFAVKHNGVEITSQWIDVNSLTGRG